MKRNIRKWLETRRESRLYELYEIHLERVEETVSALCRCIEQWMGDNVHGVEELSETVADLEEQADHLRREITQGLSRRAIVDRWIGEDLIRISRRVDRVADHSKAAARNVYLLRNQPIPQEFREGAAGMAQTVFKEIKTLKAAIEMIQEIVDVEKAMSLLESVEAREHEMDVLYFQMKEHYFNHLSESLTPQSLLILHALFHNMESAADVAEDAADIVRSILATNR
jgi:predicted phosphate transport protein (TIGR00153 family)